MVGKRSRAAELPQELRGPQDNSHFFDGGQWVPLSPGRTEKEGFGPEISFAHRLSNEWNEPVGIIKHSEGGKNLAVDWAPNNPNPQSLYAELLRKVRAAQKSRKIEVVGMLWMQGENDSRDQRMAAAYAGNLPAFIRRARKDMRSPQMFFVAGRVNPPRQNFPFVDAVRRAQEKCKENNYAFIDCDVLAKGPDNLHYTTQGVVEMGYAFADAVVRGTSKKKEASRRP